jgi:hypothetical protein
MPRCHILLTNLVEGLLAYTSITSLAGYHVRRIFLETQHNTRQLLVAKQTLMYWSIMEAGDFSISRDCLVPKFIQLA